MSAPSGIKVPDSLAAAFSSARQDAENVRALVFTIEGETFKHLTTVSPKQTYKDDIALLPPTLPSPKTPASFAYRLDSKDGGKYEWMMVTFVPDDAGVRAKMLQASSRSGLLKALGANNFKHDWFATQQSDLTPSALSAHLNHLAAPPPLSASEAALAEVREAEAAEAKRAALDPETEARRKKAVVGLGGKLSFGDGVQEALEKVAKRSDEGWVVVLELPASNTGSLALIKSEGCPPAQLASKLPAKSPSYAFYSYPTPPPPASTSASATPKSPIASARNTFQASEGGVRSVTSTWSPRIDSSGDGDAETKQTSEPESVGKAEEEKPSKGRVFFVYCCPSASPVKFRMVYSTTVRSVQQDASDKAGVQIAAKLETSDPTDLTESHLKSSLPPAKPAHSSSFPTPATSSTGMGMGMGANFGRPRPTISSVPIRSATQIPLPASIPSTPVGGTSTNEANEDSKDNIRKAFDAFGPRVNSSSSGGAGGFARPRPAGKR